MTIGTTTTRRSRRVMIVLGTRPDAIKLAPVVRSVAAHPRLEPFVVATAQHREMLDQVLSVFGIVPDTDLDVMQARQHLNDLAARVLQRVSDVIDRSSPDTVVVQGDTTTAMAASLAAFHHGVPVVHVEAGLRSGDMTSPFPEEGNRRITGVLASLHLAPTRGAAENLRREDVPAQHIVVTGNTVIDALLWTTQTARPWDAAALTDLDRDPRRIVLVTAHRRESWGLPLRRLGFALASVARAEPDTLIVLPVHRNPAVRLSLLQPLHDLPNVRITEPLAYGTFCQLMQRCHLVVTDSGGIQEEAPSLGKPVLVTRDVTERPEGVAAGTARLVGTAISDVARAVLELLRDDAAYTRMANAVNPYGDGRAAERSATAIAHLLGEGPGAAPFAATVDVQPSDRTLTPALEGV